MEKMAESANGQKLRTKRRAEEKGEQEQAR
jgi:hypothetical protein